MAVVLESIQAIPDIWSDLWQNTGVFALFMIAMVYLVLEKDKKKIDLIVIFSEIVFLIFFCPITYYVLVTILSMESFYPRMVICIPMAISIAYVAMKVVTKHGNTSKKNILLLLVALFIVVNGRSIYSTDYIRKAENLYHIPQEAIDVAQLIENQEGSLSEVTIAMPNYPAVRWVRLYDASYYSPYGRRGWLATNEDASLLYEHLNTASPAYDWILMLAYVCGCDYVVTYNSVASDGFLENGCYIVGQTENYTVYNIKGYINYSEEVEEKRNAYLATWYGGEQID